VKDPEQEPEVIDLQEWSFQHMPEPPKVDLVELGGRVIRIFTEALAECKLLDIFAGIRLEYRHDTHDFNVWFNFGEHKLEDLGWFTDPTRGVIEYKGKPKE
jgi:hypothetical protein